MFRNLLCFLGREQKFAVRAPKTVHVSLILLSHFAFQLSLGNKMNHLLASCKAVRLAVVKSLTQIYGKYMKKKITSNKIEYLWSGKTFVNTSLLSFPKQSTLLFVTVKRKGLQIKKTMKN